MKCTKCDKEATYDVPELLCDEHWAEWWTVGEDGQENPEYKEEVLEQIKEGYCGVDGCGEEAVLVTRFVTDSGPTFDAFCSKHLNVASKYIQMIAEEIGTKQENIE